MNPTENPGGRLIKSVIRTEPGWLSENKGTEPELRAYKKH